MDEIQRVLNHIGLESKKVENKANELVRMTKLKARKIANQACIFSICVHLACKILNVPLRKESELIQRSGTTPKKYKQVMLILQNALGIRRGEDIRGLAIKFGCLSVVSMCAKTWTAYKVMMYG